MKITRIKPKKNWTKISDIFEFLIFMQLPVEITITIIGSFFSQHLYNTIFFPLAMLTVPVALLFAGLALYANHKSEI